MNGPDLLKEEENILKGKNVEDKKERVFKGFAEGRSKWITSNH